jgi:hypothetical protein
VVVGTVLVAVAGWLTGCGGGTSAGTGGASPVAEGESSPETAVETFLFAAKEGLEARLAGEFTVADRAYEKMAAVFGTENGSIRRSYDASEVRDRMIVLSSCLRPAQFTIISHPDPNAWQKKVTVVTVDNAAVQRSGGARRSLVHRADRSGRVHLLNTAQLARL